MKSTAKAAALARGVSDLLSKRFDGGAGVNTVRQANDANGWPMLFVSAGGTETAGSQLIVIRFSNIGMGSPDVFGNATTAYAPTIAELAYELSAADNAIPKDVDLWTAGFEVIKTGCKFQVKEIANGTAVTETSMNAKAPDTNLEDLYWPTKSV